MHHKAGRGEGHGCVVLLHDILFLHLYHEGACQLTGDPTVYPVELHHLVHVVLVVILRVVLPPLHVEVEGGQEGQALACHACALGTMALTTAVVLACQLGLQGMPHLHGVMGRAVDDDAFVLLEVVHVEGAVMPDLGDGSSEYLCTQVVHGGTSGDERQAVVTTEAYHGHGLTVPPCLDVATYHFTLHDGIVGVRTGTQASYPGEAFPW